MNPGWILALSLIPTLGGCGGRGEPAPFVEGTIALQPISWSTQAAAVGKVAAVADSQEDVAVFGNLGASVWNGGTQVGSDASVLSWRTAAVVPALDLPESWLVGVDRMGLIYRMHNRVMLQDMTARYGLLGRPVREVVAVSSALTALALMDKLAVVDGQSVSFFDIQARGLAGAAGRLAAFDGMGVLQIDFTVPHSATIQRLPLDDVVAVAFDVSAELTLVVATADALYVERSGTLVKAFDAPAGVSITSLAGSGGGVWVALGQELALFRGSQLLHGQSGQVPDGGRLVGSPSGDVWVLGGPQLLRVGERAPGGADENRWRRTMLPIFQRMCRACHLPGGSANLDLSSYAEWAVRRDRIRQRLIEQVPTPMPPPSSGSLTTLELVAVQTWVGQGL